MDGCQARGASLSGLVLALIPAAGAQRRWHSAWLGKFNGDFSHLESVRSAEDSCEECDGFFYLTKDRWLDSH